MRDYEFNFYLLFKGFEKPIYAIPATTTGSARSTVLRRT